jgi:tRNA dimethylallyltransferase
VKDFRDLALPVVEGILKRGKVPLLVGGSDYYLQALVSRSLLDDFRQGGVVGGTEGGAADRDDGGGGGGGGGGGEEEEVLNELYKAPLAHLLI